MSVACPAGHASDDDDYCSVCGAAITRGTSISTAIAPNAATGAADACPSCGESRESPDARFCEVCRYDFVAARPGPPPAGRQPTATPKPAPVRASTPTPLPVSNAPSPVGAWEIVVRVDPSLDTDPDPASPCPRDVAERVLGVDRDLLVGRHDEQRDIHPDVPLHDPGCSRRHLKFAIDPDGGLALQDLASTNGTEINKKTIAPGTRRRLAPGDEVTLGRWTRIVVRSAT